MKNELIFDVIVIGGGAAGMFAAVHCGQLNKRVLLLEPNGRLGKKLLITGKGRCNVTNNCSTQEVLNSIPRNSRFLYSALDAYPPENVLTFFEQGGCPLKTERGNRVFPVSDRSQSVLECLQRKLRDSKVSIRWERVTDLLTENGSITGVTTTNGTYSARKVILATGGVSYPATGSTGDGYRLASAVGHQIVEPIGSLVPLEVFGDECSQMQGLSLRNVGVKLLGANNKVLYKDFGELIFTHFGISGPTVLSASCHMKGDNCAFVIDLKPALDEGKLNDRILRDLDQYKNRTMENALTDLLPKSMIGVVLRRAGIRPDLQANSLTKQDRRALVEQLKGFRLNISGKRPVEEAIITSGGVKVSQINPKTMESKLISGLYFAGEIIDCDAYTGGFNLQIAWSTAYCAAVAASDET